MANKAVAPKRIEALIECMAEGEPMVVACKRPGMPSYNTVYRLLEDRESEIAKRIVRARREGWQRRAHDAVERAKAAHDAGLGRLEFDAERWYLSKMDPNHFGEKIQQDHTSSDGSMTPKSVTLEFVQPKPEGK